MAVAHETIQLLQQATLWHASRGAADEVFSTVDVADFDPGHPQELASLIVTLLNEHGRVDPMMVLTRCGERGAALVKYFTIEISENTYSTAAYCASKVREYADRRRVEAAITRAAQHISSEAPLEAVVSRLHDDLAAVERPDDLTKATLDLADILSIEDDSSPWVMRDMLRTGERAIFTGMEGGGKSVLMAQICMGAAFGVDALSHDFSQHEPMRVLMLDVENSAIQVRNNARKIYPYLREITGRVTAQIEWVNERYIDLANPVDAQRVVRLAKDRMPQLMFMGSVYKLASEGEKHEASFNAISRTVDRIRAETGAAVLLEAHTGHGFNNDRSKGAGMRPDGSSRWLRWPEFGFGMVPMGKARPGVVELVAFRGNRSDDRAWPGGLRRGSSLPWEAIRQDIWDAAYAQS